MVKCIPCGTLNIVVMRNSNIKNHLINKHNFNSNNKPVAGIDYDYTGEFRIVKRTNQY
jgi:hypothetical protein